MSAVLRGLGLTAAEAHLTPDELLERVRTESPTCAACGEYVSAGQARLIWSHRLPRRVAHDGAPCTERALRRAYGDLVVEVAREAIERHGLRAEGDR